MKAWYLRTFGVSGVPRWVLIGMCVVAVALSLNVVNGIATGSFIIYTILFPLVTAHMRETITPNSKDDDATFHQYIGIVGAISFIFLPFFAVQGHYNPFSAWIVTLVAALCALIVPVVKEAPAVSAM